MSFKGKTAVITGGARGIGLAIAKAFRDAGANTAVIDLLDPPSQSGFHKTGDIADDACLRAFAQEVAKRFGKVEFLINNACLSKGGIHSGCGTEGFLYVQKVGVVAPYRLAQELLPHFAKRAAIVNISSTRALMSQADTESYSAAKGGLLALTHALAASLAGRVRVNAISPGWIDTQSGSWSEADKAQHFAGRIGTPEDIAKLVLFLCSDDASFITGENICVDGGMSKRMIYHGDEQWSYLS